MKVTILKLADDRFRLRVETKDQFGKRAFAYETVRGTRAEAEARMEELRRGASVATNRSYTFDEYFETWVSDRLAYSEIRDTTAALYRRQVRHFSKVLGHKRLTDFTRHDIDNAWRHLLKTINPPHVRDVAKCVKTVFSGAHQAGLIPANPAALAKTPKNKRDAKATTFTEDQLKMLVENSKAWGPLGLLVRVALATGFRRGEVCALQWGDIDFERCTISVQRAIRDLNGVPSSALRRRKPPPVPITVPKALLDELRPLQAERDAWLFGEKGKMPSPILIGHRVVHRFEKIGLGQFSLHDLRHAHATYLLQKRMPLKAVSQRLGHGNVTITLGIYAHVMPGDDEQLANAVNDLL